MGGIRKETHVTVFYLYSVPITLFIFHFIIIIIITVIILTSSISCRSYDSKIAISRTHAQSNQQKCVQIIGNIHEPICGEGRVGPSFLECVVEWNILGTTAGEMKTQIYRKYSPVLIKRTCLLGCVCVCGFCWQFSTGLERGRTMIEEFV